MKTAAELGVTQPAVSQWLSGACRMSAAIAFRAQVKNLRSYPGLGALL
ncbi:helix-turn-helix domain-containing protein [Azotobacter salinestris]